MPAELPAELPAESDDGLPAESDGPSDTADAGTPDRTTDPFEPTPQICFVSVQIWRNRDSARKRQAEWTAKLRWMAKFDPGVINEVYVGFRSSPRKARETVRRHVVEGKVSAAWADEFARLTADLDEDTRVGPMTKRLYGEGKTGTSSNAIQAFEHAWAAMTLDAAGMAPQHLMLDFGDGGPISLDRFSRSNGQAKNAAQWIILFDPDGLQAAKRDLADLRKYKAQNRQVQAHSPSTALGELIAHHVKPLTDKVAAQAFELDRLRRDVATLKTEAGEMQVRIAFLASDLAKVK